MQFSEFVYIFKINFNSDNLKMEITNQLKYFKKINKSDNKIIKFASVLQRC